MDKNQLDSMKIAELRELAESSNVEGFESMYLDAKYRWWEHHQIPILMLFLFLFQWLEK